MKAINQQAPVTCSKTITIGANREKVWHTLANISQWANWQHEISAAKLQGALNSGTTFTWKTGGTKIRSTLHTVNPPHELGWTGKTMGLFAIHNWTLTEQGDHTLVYVEESMEGALAKFFRKSFSKTLEKGMQTWLELLKQECEKQADQR